MKTEQIKKLLADFESRVNNQNEVEFWYARDLQTLLGYDRWENFLNVVLKAATACETAGEAVDDHFLMVTKMIELGKGAEREVSDVALDRYACLLVAQNGSPSKEEIAFAQTYFAVQTRTAELIQQGLSDRRRVSERKKLSDSENKLSGVIAARLGSDASFATIRSKGDAALFGGNSTNAMKVRLGVPGGRALADFLPTVLIKAKDFAAAITAHNVEADENKNSEQSITDEHVQNNKEVRGALIRRSITPETLPPSEDVKKVERRLASEQKKLPKQSTKKP
jgi:DNA-damage-inducible protein D